MTRQLLQRRLRAALHGERGFTILETVIAMTVVFASLTALAYTATVGFRYVAIGRDRIQATGAANQIMEEIRGLAYSKITAGMSSADLTGDPNIVTCSGVQRLESCSGEKIVSSTFTGGYAAAWIVPHSGSFTAGNIDIDWHTYVTNDSPADTPYRVTVIVAWSGDVAPGNSSNFVRLDSQFWSPTGCVSSSTHPFAAPCQPFFYGQAVVPQSSFSFVGTLHDGDVDLSEATLLTPGTQSTLQQEQVTETNAITRSGGVTVTDSTGLELSGPLETTSSADSDVGSSTGSTDGATINNGTQYFLERLQTDTPGSIGLQLTIPTGDVGNNGVSIAAKATDTYACPPAGTRQTDQAPCAGSQVKQGGTATAVIPLSHALASLGTMTAVRVTAPSTTYSTALVHRDAVTGYDGLVNTSASRTLGTIQLGGLPTGMLTPPAGMSTTNTDDTNYCMRITGYTDSASAIAGPRTTTDPSATIGSGGRFYYLSGSSYSFKSVDSTNLTPLSVSCSSSQTIAGQLVTWQVTVAAGGIVPATTETTETTTSDAQTRTEASATANGITVTMQYTLTVGTTTEVDLTVTADVGDLIANGVYGAPPSAG